MYNLFKVKFISNKILNLNVKLYSTTPSKLNQDKIRNIAILAHIDAGKLILLY